MALTILKAVNQGFQAGATLLDAHIDAESLLHALHASPVPSDAGMKALNRLRDIARDNPDAVAMQTNAIQLLCGALLTLQATSDPDAAAGLQDVLETLNFIVGSKAEGERADRQQQGHDEGQQQHVTADQRRHLSTIMDQTQDGKVLFGLLQAQKDVYVAYDTMVLLQHLYRHFSSKVAQTILSDPMGLSSLMQILQDAKTDFVRNEALQLLYLLTETNTEIQKIVTFQGCIESLFAVISEEDISRHFTSVTRTALRCLLNFLSNPYCVKYVRETGGIRAMCDLMAKALEPTKTAEDSSPTAASSRSVEGDDHKCAQAVEYLIRGTILLLQGGGEAPEAGKSVEHNQNAFVSSGFLDLACRHVNDTRLPLDLRHQVCEAILRVACGNAQASKALQSFTKCDDRHTEWASRHRVGHSSANRDGQTDVSVPPPLFFLVDELLADSTDLPMRAAIATTIQLLVAGDTNLQSFLLSTLAPQLQPDPSCIAFNTMPPGRAIVQSIDDVMRARQHDGKTATDEEEEKRESELAEGLMVQKLWYGLEVVLAMLGTSQEVQSVAVQMPVEIPSDAGPAETLSGKLLRLFGLLAKETLAIGKTTTTTTSSSTTQQLDGRLTRPHKEGLRPEWVGVSLLGLLKVFIQWVEHCVTAMAPLIASPVYMPMLLDLVQFSVSKSVASPGSVIDEAATHLQGLAALLLGMCVENLDAQKASSSPPSPGGAASSSGGGGQDEAISSGTAMNAAALLSVLATRVGLDEFNQKIERLQRTEAFARCSKLLFPPHAKGKVPNTFIVYSPGFARLVKAHYETLQRKMVQLYLSSQANQITSAAVGGGGSIVSTDVAEHYKDLIKMQDNELRALKADNEKLRQEVAEYAKRSIAADSALLVVKLDALTEECKRLRQEVDTLTVESSRKEAALSTERQSNRVKITEMEKQLEALVVAYDALEASIATKDDELTNLRATVEARQDATQVAQSEAYAKALKDLMHTKRQLEDLRRDHDVLLEVLVLIAEEQPSTQQFLCPLTQTPSQQTLEQQQEPPLSPLPSSPSLTTAIKASHVVPEKPHTQRESPPNVRKTLLHDRRADQDTMTSPTHRARLPSYPETPYPSPMAPYERPSPVSDEAMSPMPVLSSPAMAAERRTDANEVTPKKQPARIPSESPLGKRVPFPVHPPLTAVPVPTQPPPDSLVAPTLSASLQRPSQEPAKYSPTFGQASNSPEGRVAARVSNEDEVLLFSASQDRTPPKTPPTNESNNVPSTIATLAWRVR
ncbi:unnamed protein product [Vitrella brassicaformis CCMP3155]|uniref:Vesicle tethering protein Uso1/P115-like head domain-containing protein n=2 Tax=Vitrella brassicaformis TaxID=1169539 RepID=A0A0G4G991_VITBC|nr:unnamed protein product [Vitrella brassicaformis CCMP3155]|eukprot:CEM25445.1 unnamed protein product [Vitrella brassicaformis CCMP3155]